MGLDQHLRCLLPVISIIQTLLALLLVGIQAPFGMLLLCYHPSARLLKFACLPIIRHPHNTSALHSLFAFHHQHHLGVVDLVAGGNSHPVWDVSFAPSNFCPPSLRSVCLLIVQHLSNTSALHCMSSKIFNINFITKYAR
jgi:hypothetical protein